MQTLTTGHFHFDGLEGYGGDEPSPEQWHWPRLPDGQIIGETTITLEDYQRRARKRSIIFFTTDTRRE